MALVLPDPLVTISSIVQEGWNPANVDGAEPTFTQAADVKVRRANRGNQNPGDTIHFYTISESPGRLGIDYQYRRRDDVIAVQVHSVVSRAHERKLLAEIERTINAQRVNPTTLPAGAFGYDTLNLEVPWQDLSSKTTRKWEHVTKIRLQTFAELITTA